VDQNISQSERAFCLSLLLSIASLATQRYNGEGDRGRCCRKEIERNWAFPGVLRDTSPESPERECNSKLGIFLYFSQIWQYSNMKVENLAVKIWSQKSMKKKPKTKK
jgi:hypothetical protein